MARDYEMDPTGLQQIASSRQMQNMTNAMASAGKSAAEAISPVGETRVYRDSWEVRSSSDRVGHGREKRAAATLINTAPYASTVERRHHILATVKAVLESRGF